MRVTRRGRVPEVIAILACRLGILVERAGICLYDRFKEQA